MAYQLIETVTLTAAASSIEFTAIPQDGVDLLCVVNARSSSGGDINNPARFTFNNDTASNYSAISLNGNGSTASSFSGTSAFFLGGFVNGSGTTANTFSNNGCYVSNYTSAVAKSLSADKVTENNATSSDIRISAGLWNNSAAITSVQVAFPSATVVAGSTFSLYKIS